MNDKVDALGVLGVLVSVLLEYRLWLPVARVDDVGHSLRVFEPPPVALVAVEVKTDVAVCDS